MQAVTITQITAPELESLIENSLRKILSTQPSKPSQVEPETPITIPDAASFLGVKVPTVYGLIAKGELQPMKRSKRCYFLKSDLLNYLKAGRKPSQLDIQNEADNYLSKRKGA